MNSTRLERLRCILALFVVGGCLASAGISTASAEVVSFSYQAQLLDDLSSFPFPVGQMVFGYYRFELNTPPTTYPGDYTVTVYNDAIIEHSVTIEGYGTAVGSGGSIGLGDPVRTTGSPTYLSDYYAAGSNVTGITVDSSRGDRDILSASIQLKDIDQTALDSEDLPATPPDLAPFKDHITSTRVSDRAELWMNFDFPDGSTNAAVFEVISLAVLVPEPGAPLAALFLAMACLGHRRSRHGRCQR